MSQQSEAPTSASIQTPEYSRDERLFLLRLAHASIAAELAGKNPALPDLIGHLAELRGAFTTLHLEGNLRGCIGYVVPTQPLYRTVAETARSAAFEDPRFPPVTMAEAPGLNIEISVLSALVPIRPEDVVVGRHGLLVSKDGHRGLLLPQVPVEFGWDRETFLAQTCRKAGLSPKAMSQDIDLMAFTAEVFGDAELGDAGS